MLMLSPLLMSLQGALGGAGSGNPSTAMLLKAGLSLSKSQSAATPKI